MFGKTNASTSGTSGTGDKITVRNKTGTAIENGDKIWVSKSVHSESSHYVFSGESSQAGYSCCLDRSGTTAFVYGNLFSISETSAVMIGSLNPYRSIGTIKYGPEQSIFGTGIRIDGNAPYAFSFDSGTNNFYIGKNYVTRAENVAISTFDLATGDILETYVNNNLHWASENYSRGFMCVVNDKIYSFNAFTEGCGKITLNDADKSLSFTPINGVNETLTPFGVTLDNKYIFCTNSSSAAGNGNLKILQMVDEDTIRILNPAEIPVELQPFTTGLSTHFTFNPYNGVFNAASQSQNKSVTMRYHNGQWQKITLKFPENVTINFSGPITFSDDLSRCLHCGNNTNYIGIINFGVKAEYAAYKFDPNLISDGSLTAQALADAQPGEEFAAATILPQTIQISAVTNADNAVITAK